MVTETEIGKLESSGRKPLKKSRVRFFNLMVYAIMAGIVLLLGSILFFLIRSTFS